MELTLLVFPNVDRLARGSGLLAVVLLAASSTPAPAKTSIQSKAIIRLTEKDNGATLHANVGDIFEIRLSASANACPPVPLAPSLSKSFQLLTRNQLRLGSEFYQSWTVRMAVPGRNALHIGVAEPKVGGCGGGIETFYFDVSP